MVTTATEQCRDSDGSERPQAKRQKLRCGGEEDLKITVGGGCEGAVVVTEGDLVVDEAAEDERKNNGGGEGEGGEKGTVGGGGSDDGEEDENNKKVAVYWYHSIIMATHSKYIDTMISGPGIECSRTPYELNFPEIEPDVWDAMMKFVSDLSAARGMTVADAMMVAEWYDKYDFEEGLRLCDKVLADFFLEETEKAKKLKKYTRTLFRALPSTNTGKFVEALVLADKLNLTQARNVGVEYLENDVIDKNGTMLEQMHVKELVPLFAKRKSEVEEKPWQASYLRNYSKEDISSPLFPRLFTYEFEWYASLYIATRACPLIRLSGTGSKADGRRRVRL